MSPVYKRKDHYYQKAKEQGLASRAIFKLEEIDRQYRLFDVGGRVIDLGCAPGGWLQYIAKKIGTSGKAVGIDLLKVKAQFPSYVTILQGDATDAKIQSEALKLLGGSADAVVSDLSPNLSGVRFRDNFLSYELALTVLKVAKQFLKKGGNLVLKIFPGDELPNYKKELLLAFEEIKTFIPDATRKGSSEIYLIAKGFKLPTHHP